MEDRIELTPSGMDRERRAYNNFVNMSKNLEAVAGSLTGKNVRVEPGVVSRTNGSLIEVAVPPELADQPEHSRNLCGKKDNLGIQMCPSCAVRDEIISSLRHEISHIVYDSFMPPVRVGQLATKVNKVLDKKVTLTGHETYHEVASVCDPHLPGILNALDDIRINTLAAQASPGLGAMHKARYEKLIRVGVKTGDGSFKSFGDLPDDAQFVAAVLFAHQGYEYGRTFQKAHIKNATSTQVGKIIKRLIAPEGTSVHRSMLAAIDLLAAARAMGYFQIKEDEEEDKKKSNSQSDRGGGSSGQMERQDVRPVEQPGASQESPSPSENDGEDDSGDPEGDGGSQGGKGEDEAGDGGGGEDFNEDGGKEDRDDKTSGNQGYQESSGSDSPGNEPDDEDSSDSPSGCSEGQIKESQSSVEDVDTVVSQLVGHDAEHGEVTEGAEGLDKGNLNKVISSLKYLDNVPTKLGGVSFTPEGKYNGLFVQDFEYSIGDVNRAVQKARIAFTKNDTESYDRNLRSGNIVGAALGRRAPFGDERIFGRRVTPDVRKYELLIGLDISGSTAGPRISQIKDAAAALAEVCKRSGIDFGIYCHTSTVGQAFISPQSGYLESLRIVEVKKVKSPWGDDVKNTLRSLEPSGANLDGHTLQFYRRMMDKSQATDKLIMYFTDGKMPAMNYEEELPVLKSEIKKCKSRGYTLLGVGIGTDSPKRHGLDTVEVNGPGDIRLVIDRLARVMPG